MLPLFLSFFHPIFFSYLQVMMACMGARSSSKLSQIGQPTAELAGLERLKNYPYLIIGKTVLPLYVMMACMGARSSSKLSSARSDNRLRS